LTPPFSTGLVAVVSIIASELESFFGDKAGQSGEGVQGGEPFRGGRVKVGALRGARIISDDAGVSIIMEAGERKGGVNEVGSEPFPGRAVERRDAFSLVGGKSGMVEAVEDIDGGLADSAGGEQVFNHMVAEEQHELLSVERRNRFKAAVGGPDSPAGDGVDMGMKVKVISVALNGDDDARQGGRVGGDFLKHLLEGLPGGFAEQAEFLGVVSEDGAQKLWHGEDELGVADLFEDVSVEPLGEKQDALLLARGAKEAAFAGVGEDGLIAAAVAAKTRKTSMQISTFQILAHHLADDGTPTAILLLIPIVVNALELFEIVFD